MTNQSNQHSIIDIVLLIRRHSLKMIDDEKCVFILTICMYYPWLSPDM